MSSFAITPVSAVPAAGQPATGKAHARLTAAGDQPQPLVFAVGEAGQHYAAVKVVIKDYQGATVASFTLAALSGTQNVIWTPQPGTRAGGFAAYWEGAKLAVTNR